MDELREEPLEKRIDEVSDILTKVMTIVVSAIDDLNQKIVTLHHQFTAIQNQQAQISQEIQVLKTSPMAAGATSGTPVVTPMSGLQTPAVQAAPQPKLEPKPISPMSARSAINSELKALFSRRKKD